MIVQATILAWFAVAGSSSITLERGCEDDALLVETASATQQALESRGWRVLDVGGERCGWSELETGREHYLRAQSAFERLALGETAQALQAARDVLYSGARLRPAAELFVDIEMFRGWMALDRADAATARSAFAAVIALRPELEPPATRYPPHVIQAFTAAAQGLRPQVGELELTSAPSGAEVWIDGVRRCETPCRLGGLVAGEHAVELQQPGHQGFARWVRIGAGELAREQVELAPRGVGELHLSLSRVGDTPSSPLEARLAGRVSARHEIVYGAPPARAGSTIAAWVVASSEAEAPRAWYASRWLWGSVAAVGGVIATWLIVDHVRDGRDGRWTVITP